MLNECRLIKSEMLTFFYLVKNIRAMNGSINLSIFMLFGSFMKSVSQDDGLDYPFSVPNFEIQSQGKLDPLFICHSYFWNSYANNSGFFFLN